MKSEFFLILVFTIDNLVSPFDSSFYFEDERVMVTLVISSQTILDLVNKSRVDIETEAHVVLLLCLCILLEISRFLV